MTTSNFDNINTVSDLVEQNKTWTPEEIWEKVIDLDPGDLQVFCHNVVNRLHLFHKLHVKELLKDETVDPKNLQMWVKDLTIYSSVLDQLNKISD